ncbi:MAG TPA: 3-isopropylmalate dehydrogenase, partial [bacterium]|nr:3-isopropylmalate dehydrogenase [bacterium]
TLRGFDAIYLGAVGHTRVAPGIMERGLLLKLRFELDQYINLRPVRLFPGVPSPLAGKGPEDIDLVVIRENTESLYLGMGGTAREGTPREVSTQEMLSTRFGVERCLRYAFDTARRRREAGKPGRLTLVHKTNVLTHCGGTWFRAFEELGERDYPDVERNYHHVDACCMYLVTSPERYDVVVTENMFGDIITDLGAAVSGGMGMAASGNINPSGVGMFEPVHGSAPDIAGRNRANPMAAIVSMAMLLEETGRNRALPQAVRAGELVYAAALAVSPRLEGEGMDRLRQGTQEVGRMVVEEIGATGSGGAADEK